jgi:phosphatidylserine decarboxylase
MNKNFIVEEGYKPIFISLIITFLLYAFDLEFLGAIGVVFTLLLVYIYRDTARYIYENPSNILAPIDGKVIALEEKNDKIKIYVQVSLLDNHNIRSPFKSQCSIKMRQFGLNLDPSSYKGSLLNEQVKLKLLSNEYKDKSIELKLISGFYNPSISINSNENYEQGETLGLFVNGIAEITLDSMETSIKINDKIKAGQTIIS